ncbi:MAG: hypothetical protein EA401_10565 [Planctomycetota bacterium]|nr:MAG: hypothetical protein EA401_10565 [Planctomycetota bacterium]
MGKLITWLAVGCLGMILLTGGCVVGCGALLISLLTNSAPYSHAVATAEAHPAVVEVLGEPIEAGWLVQGSIETHNQDGEVDLSIPLSGPQGSGRLYVEGRRRKGEWTYTRLYFRSHDGRRVDLLEQEVDPNLLTP